ncbi:hypothetical protein MMC19_004022 [Ptychographa xylographoides]|nr:hypothetical protein [Ptychographa xylographoides]
MSSKPSIPTYNIPTTSSTRIQLDPANPGTIIRYAFAVEAFFNIFGAIPMLFTPARLLSNLTVDPVTPLACSLTQWLGALVLSLTVPLLLCLPNTKRAVESRPTVYWTLGAGEAAAVVVMLVQLANGGNGFGITFLRVSILNLGGLCAWRAWVLGYRPEWVGGYRKAREGKGE